MYFTGFSVTCKKMATWNFEPPTSGVGGTSSVFIIFVYKLMIGSSKNYRENYPKKCFEHKKKVKFNLWVKR